MRHLFLLLFVVTCWMTLSLPATRLGRSAFPLTAAQAEAEPTAASPMAPETTPTVAPEATATEEPTAAPTPEAPTPAPTGTGGPSTTPSEMPAATPTVELPSETISEPEATATLSLPATATTENATITPAATSSTPAPLPSAGATIEPSPTQTPVAATPDDRDLTPSPLLTPTSPPGSELETPTSLPSATPASTDTPEAATITPTASAAPTDPGTPLPTELPTWTPTPTATATAIGTPLATQLPTPTPTPSGQAPSITQIDIPAFPPVALNGANQNVLLPLESFTVTNLWGTRDGWRVVVSASQMAEIDPATGKYVPGGKTLPRGVLRMSEPSVTAAASAGPGPHVRRGPYVIDNGAATVIASAEPGAGMGIYTFSGATLSLRIPASAYARTYRSDITLTVIAGP